MTRFRKHLPVIVIVLVGLVVFWAMVRLPSQLQLETYKKMLAANGEKMEIQQLLPPRVPPQRNGADIVDKAYGLLLTYGDDWTNLPPAMRMIAPDKAIVCFEQPDAHDNYFTNSWSNILKIVDADHAGTEWLRQVMSHPALDFHLDYSPGIEERLTNLTRFCADRLAAEAVCDLRVGDTPSARTNICAILSLVDGEHNEWLMDSQYARRVMTFRAAAASWEFLQSSNITDEDLAFLQKNWKRLEYIQALEKTILMRRAILESTIKRMRDSEVYFKSQMSWENSSESYGDFGDDLDSTMNEIKMSYGNAMWHSSWTYSDELQMLQNYQLILQTIRAIETNRFYAPAWINMMNQLNAITTSHEGGDLGVIRWMFSGYPWEGKDLERTMQAEAAKSMVITAIALKRYQLKHGNYPPDLSLLIPEFLSVVPSDPVDGKPLRYRLKPDGTFLLYSIGPDGKDDDGDASLIDGLSHYYWLDLRARDWVWPQAATPEEIKNYYAHPPRSY